MKGRDVGFVVDRNCLTDYDQGVSRVKIVEQRQESGFGK